MWSRTRKARREITVRRETRPKPWQQPWAKGELSSLSVSMLWGGRLAVVTTILSTQVLDLCLNHPPLAPNL
jgi:hypothetical protein